MTALTSQQIAKLDTAKAEIKSTIRKDAEKHGWRRLRVTSARRGGKFKVSETQFRSELELSWLAGEMSSAERILRCIELDEDLNSRDMIRGELHLYILDVKKELEKHLGPLGFGIEHLLEGPMATENIREHLLAPRNNQGNEDGTADSIN